MPQPRLVKTLVGLVLGFGIGLGCRLSGIPSPAPPVLTGALLVVSMTVGWLLVDYWASQRPKSNADLCGGPTGLPGGDA